MSGLEFEQKVVYGPSGRGDVRFNKKKNGQVSSVKVIDEDTTVYPIAPDNVGDDVIQESRKGVYYSLNADETRLDAVRPWEGSFPVKFVGFSRRGEDQEEAEPYLKRGGERKKTHKSGKTSKFTVPDQLRFTSVFEITAGEFKGYTYLYWLPYIFERGKDGGTKVTARSGTALDRIKQFLELTGWDLSHDIPFSENILPYLEGQLLDRANDNQFMLVAERGWPIRLEKIGTGVSFS